MMKTITVIASALMLAIFIITPVYSQTCAAAFLLENPYIERGAGDIIEMPVYLYNNCSAGGLAVEFNITPGSIVQFVDVDFTDSPFGDWDYLNYTMPNGNSQRLRVVAIANVDSTFHNPSLPPSQGILLFTIRLTFACTYYTDTTAQVYINVDSTSISDSSGYHVFDNVGYNGGTVYIGGDVAIRGDCNCNGTLIGSDVTYLINYFRGTGGCPCSLCAGDANGDGSIIGSDVTYLVRFFTGIGNPPPPCGD